MEATWPETDLSDFDGLDSLERSAWLGMFNGGHLSGLASFDRRPGDVFMGKAECEWVNFSDFWLEKAVGLGWVEILSKRRSDGGNAWIYDLGITELGRTIRAAELDRHRKRSACRIICEFGQFLNGQDGWWSYV